MAKSQWETVGAFQYNSRDLIGHGAFAVVFKGRNAEKPQDVVAIKCIQKKNLVKSRTLLEKEIRILSHLTAVKHENIVALLDYKETPQYVYLVMEYCNGGDLADYLQANGTLSEDSVKLFLRQLAKAMKALNGKGIVHRDLKPQNILLSSTKSHPKPHEITLKIADFGFARFLQDGVMAATLCGSPMYMAPEVIMSLPYDSKADLWSLGTIVYQCLVGKAPFQASSPQALKQFYEKSPNLKPKIPANTSPNMRDLLLRMLRRDAKDRIDFDELSVHPFLETERPGIPASGTPQTGPPGPTAAWASKPREIESAQKQSIPFPRSLPSRTAPIEEEDDFVIVPENLPSTTAGSVNVRHRSNESPSVEKQSQRPTSEPIPVPTQKEAYYQIQSSLRNSESSSSNCSSPATAKKGAGSRMEPASPSTSPQKRSLRGRSISTPGSAAGAKPASEARSSPISMRRVSSTDMYEDVASLSPPSVKFHVGTPPRGRTNSGNYYGSNSSLNRILTSSPPPSSFMAAACGPCGAIVPTSPTSPLRRSGDSIAPCLLAHAVVSPPSLPAFFHGNQMCGGILGPDHGHGHCSPHRAQTMPDIARHARQCYRACQPADYFSSGNVAEKIGSAPCRRWSCAIMGPQGAEPQFACNNMLHDPCSPPDFDGVIFAAPELPEDTLLEREHNETLARLQLVLALADCVIELGEETGSPLALAAGNKESGAQSPNKHWAKPGRLSPLSPNSEDLPVVEKLATVREERHGEAAGWAEVDEERPLPSGGKFEPRRRRESGRRRDEEAEERSEIEPVAERLALLLKACRLLAAALHLARDEMTAHRLQASAAVRQVVSDLHARFQSCLSKVHKVYDSGPFSRDELHRHLGKISADRLLYQHAIRMCQSAALDELLGMSQACCVRYQTAQILLHCLAQTVKHSRDREILNEYRKSVEKRLFLLQQQGFVMAVDRSSSSN